MVSVKVPVLEPEAIIAELELNVARESLESDSATGVPPEAPLPEIITVPVTTSPPKPVFADRVKVDRVGGLTVSVPEPELVPTVAVTCTVLIDATPRLVTGNVADDLPAGTVTDASTVAADVLSDASATTNPFAGAARVMVTVPVTAVELPPMTELGAITTDFTDGWLTVRVAETEAPALVAVIFA